MLIIVEQCAVPLWRQDGIGGGHDVTLWCQTTIYLTAPYRYLVYLMQPSIDLTRHGSVTFLRDYFLMATPHSNRTGAEPL